MSFEDLQKKWTAQFTGDGEAATARDALLKRVRDTERRFWLGVMLQAAADVLCLGVFAWITAVSVQHGRPFPPVEIRPHRAILVAAWALCFVFHFAGLKLRVLQAPATSEPASAAFPGRVCRDGTRFYALVLWRDVREFLAGLFVLIMGSLEAWHATRFPLLDWAAVALLAAAIGGFVAHRFKSSRFRPLINDTLPGMLAWSAEQARRQVQLLENIHWYAGPVFLAVILLVPVRGAIERGGVHQAEILATLTFVFAGGWTWRLNQWAVRSRLRPRLEALEKLQTELPSQ